MSKKNLLKFEIFSASGRSMPLREGQAVTHNSKTSDFLAKFLILSPETSGHAHFKRWGQPLQSSTVTWSVLPKRKNIFAITEVI